MFKLSVMGNDSIWFFPTMCIIHKCCVNCVRVVFSDEGRNLNQLDDFMECLSKFTRYNSVRPLATLSYASDLYNGSSIVSRYKKEKFDWTYDWTSSFSCFMTFYRVCDEPNHCL